MTVFTQRKFVADFRQAKSDFLHKSAVLRFSDPLFRPPTYDDHLRLIEKRVVDFLCYGWGSASENRAKIGDFAPTRSLWSKISGRRGRPPPIIFARLVIPMNALQLCWTFFDRCYSWGATSDYRFKIGDFAPTGAGWPKISGRRGRPPPTILLLIKLG